MRFVLSIVAAVASVGATSYHKDPKKNANANQVVDKDEIFNNWPYDKDGNERLVDETIDASAEEAQVEAPMSPIEKCSSTVMGIMIELAEDPSRKVDTIEVVLGHLSPSERYECLTSVAEMLIEYPGMLEDLSEDDQIINDAVYMNQEEKARLIAQKGPGAITCWPWTLKRPNVKKMTLAL